MAHIPYKMPVQEPEQLLENSIEFYEKMATRRSVRFFSDRAVPQAVIENVIKTAGTAPSGANKQPWHFVAISNAEVKRKIRIAAEEEERAFYNQRASEAWLRDLAPLGTNWQKPFLETAPWLIAVFRQTFENTATGIQKNYYVQESVGIACGFLIAAIHQAGLATLTHTPSPMQFLADILNRPNNEKPFLLLPVGYVAKDATVPNIARKPQSEIATFMV